VRSLLSDARVFAVSFDCTLDDGSHQKETYKPDSGATEARNNSNLSDRIGKVG
jgi:hypothetical protein